VKKIVLALAVAVATAAAANAQTAATKAPAAKPAAQTKAHAEKAAPMKAEVVSTDAAAKTITVAIAATQFDGRNAADCRPCVSRSPPMKAAFLAAVVVERNACRGAASGTALHARLAPRARLLVRRPRMKHFSLLRSFHFADLFTIANGCCGVVAVFHAMRFHATQDGRSLLLTALLVPVAIHV